LAARRHRRNLAAAADDCDGDGGTDGVQGDTVPSAAVPE
jgi:hypothetical protein